MHWVHEFRLLKGIKSPGINEVLFIVTAPNNVCQSRHSLLLHFFPGLLVSRSAHRVYFLFQFDQTVPIATPLKLGPVEAIVTSFFHQVLDLVFLRLRQGAVLQVRHHPLRRDA